MKKLQILLTAACFLLLPLVAQAEHKTTTKTSGATSVAKLVSNFDAAWNKGDAKAIAAMFTTDGDLVNPMGKEVNGRKAIEAFLAKELNGVLKGSKGSSRVNEIHTLDANTAFVDAECTMTFSKKDHGTHPAVKHQVSFVAKKSGAVWNFAAVRAYVFVPEAKCDSKKMCASEKKHMCPKEGRCVKCEKKKK